MKVMIMGMDGYLGWPLAMHLSAKGHSISGVDNFSRRKNVEELNAQSATPIKSMARGSMLIRKPLGGSWFFMREILQRLTSLTRLLGKRSPTA